MKHLFSSFMITSMLLMLTACGFHLRGASEDKIEIKELAVSSPDTYGPMVQEVKSRLTQAGVHIYDMATYTLVVSSEEETRTLAFSNSIRGTDTGRVLTLSYKIYGPDKLLLVSDSVEARGSYIDDNNNIVANEMQKDRIAKELRENATTLLMYRLQKITMADLEALLKKAEETKRLKEEAIKMQEKALKQNRESLQHSIPLGELENLNK